jgi:hypothetical protein
MKTTLNIHDTVMAELKREAARQGRTMSELVEMALRLLLQSQRKRGSVPPLPKFHSGGACRYCGPQCPLPGPGGASTVRVATTVLPAYSAALR